MKIQASTVMRLVQNRMDHFRPNCLRSQQNTWTSTRLLKAHRLRIYRLTQAVFTAKHAFYRCSLSRLVASVT